MSKFIIPQKFKVAVVNSWEDNCRVIIPITETLQQTISELKKIIEDNKESIGRLTAITGYSHEVCPCYFFTDVTKRSELSADIKQRIIALDVLFTELFEEDEERVVIMELENNFLNLLKVSSIVSEEPELTIWGHGNSNFQFSDYDKHSNRYESRDISLDIFSEPVEIVMAW